MLSRTKRLQIGLTVLVSSGPYSVTLLRNLHESERRSLQLKETPLTGDYVGVSDSDRCCRPGQIRDNGACQSPPQWRTCQRPSNTGD